MLEPYMKSWPIAVGDHGIANGCERDVQVFLPRPVSRISISTTCGCGLSLGATSGPAIFGVNLAIAEPLRGGMGVAVLRARRGSCRAPSTRNAAPGSTAQF